MKSIITHMGVSAHRQIKLDALIAGQSIRYYILSKLLTPEQLARDDDERRRERAETVNGTLSAVFIPTPKPDTGDKP